MCFLFQKTRKCQYKGRTYWIQSSHSLNLTMGENLQTKYVGLNPARCRNFSLDIIDLKWSISALVWT